jgi:hypothetical protein
MNLGLSRSIGPQIGIYVNNTVRYTRFPSLDWREGTTSLVPPVGWPTSMDLWSGTVRLGIGIAAARNSPKGEEAP